MCQVILIVLSVRRSVSAGLLKNPHSTITVGDVDFLSIKYSLLGLMLRGFATQREVFKAPRTEDASSFPASEAS